MKTIEENNRMIAEFMGVEYIDIDGVPCENMSPNDMLKEPLSYHTSWGWLMPVVEKIDNTRTLSSTEESYLYCVTINGNNWEIVDGKTGDVILHSGNYEDWKAMLFDMVRRFVEWYNENK